MKFEIDLVSGAVDPVPLKDDKPDWGDTTMARATTRILTDSMLDALLKDSMEDTVRQLALVMLSTASIAYKYRAEPDVQDFVEAAKALIEDSRSVLDKGLMLHSAETAKCGIVMMELTVRGICAALGLPYDQILRTIHNNGDLRALLVESKHIKEHTHGHE